MIGSFWNNLASDTPIIISSADTLAHLTSIEVQSVYNQGELIGILIDLINKVINPGAGKKITVFYAFSNKKNRTAAQLFYAGASQDLTLDDLAPGNVRGYSLPINYQGGHYLYIWFTADTFTNGTAQLEVDMTVLAKTMK